MRRKRDSKNLEKPTEESCNNAIRDECGRNALTNNMEDKEEEQEEQEKNEFALSDPFVCFLTAQKLTKILILILVSSTS